jgi:hypothetical protein
MDLVPVRQSLGAHLSLNARSTAPSRRPVISSATPSPKSICCRLSIAAAERRDALRQC